MVITLSTTALADDSGSKSPLNYINPIAGQEATDPDYGRIDDNSLALFKNGGGGANPSYLPDTEIYYNFALGVLPTPRA